MLQRENLTVYYWSWLAFILRQHARCAYTVSAQPKERKGTAFSLGTEWEPVYQPPPGGPS